MTHFIYGGFRSERILAGQEGGGHDDADQDEVAHDGMTLQPVTEDTQRVVLRENEE